jgi:putative sporulation protein YtaF
VWWIPVLVIGVTSNLDNLGVGVSLGVRSGRVPHRANVIIAALTMVATGAAMVLGRTLGRFLPAGAGRWSGAAIVLAVGIWSIGLALAAGADGSRRRGRILPQLRHRQLLHRPANPPTQDAPTQDTSTQRGAGEGEGVGVREAFVLGVALSVNNVGTGIGAGAAGLPPLATTVVTGLLSLVAVGAFSEIARVAGARWLGRSASLVGGVLLVAVAVLLGAGI